MQNVSDKPTRGKQIEDLVAFLFKVAACIVIPIFLIFPFIKPELDKQKRANESRTPVLTGEGPYSVTFDGIDEHDRNRIANEWIAKNSNVVEVTDKKPNGDNLTVEYKPKR